MRAARTAETVPATSVAVVDQNAHNDPMNLIRMCAGPDAGAGDVNPHMKDGVLKVAV